MSAEKINDKKTPFLKNLFNRRIPQILGIYLGVSWATIEFVDWLTNRFMLSPHWIDLMLIILLFFIPSLIILAYFHGSPGKDKWNRTEKVVVPLNIILIVLLVFFLFSGKDLGTVSKTVTVNDESGKTIDKIIPKKEFKKKITFFYFDNKTNNPEFNWLSNGLQYMLEYDLMQDPFLVITSPSSLEPSELKFDFFNQIKKAGYPDGLKIPLMLKRKLAKDQRMDYYTSGSFNRLDDSYSVTFSIYKTNNARKIATITLSNKSFFELIDLLSIKIKEAVGLPASYLDSTVDLSLTESYTNNIQAVKFATQSTNSVIFNNDWPLAEKQIKEAIKLDPTFVHAYRWLSYIYLFTNQPEKKAQMYTKNSPIMKYSYKLPERAQHFDKLFQHSNSGNIKKMIEYLLMMTKIYPDDIEILQILSTIYTSIKETEKAISVLKTILKIDPTSFNTYITLGEQYLVLNNSKEALFNFSQYSKLNPGKTEGLILTGDHYQKSGKFGEAREMYEKASTIDMENIQVMLKLAILDRVLGNFNSAEEQLNKILVNSTENEQMAIHNELAALYRVKGQLQLSLKNLKKVFQFKDKLNNPLYALVFKISHLEAFVDAGQSIEAFKLLETLKSQIDKSMIFFIKAGYILVYNQMQEYQKANEVLSEIESGILASNTPNYLFTLYKTKGLLAEQSENFKNAVEHFQKAMEYKPDKNELLRFLSRIYKKAKDYKNAEKFINKALMMVPFDPHSNFEQAKIYFAQSKIEEGLISLKKVLKIWKEADQDFAPAIEARQLMQQYANNSKTLE